MSNTCFSHNDDWKCLGELLEKLPRTINKSKAIVMSVEALNKQITAKTNLSLDDFEEPNVVRLEADPKIWRQQLKEMNVQELRDLQKLMQKRKSLVDDAIYKETL